MLVKSEGIILQNIKYADKKIILKIYTKKYGLVTLHAVTGSKPAAKVKSSGIMPLNQVEISFVQKQNRDVQQLTESRSTFIYSNLTRDYNKLSIAQFLNEVMIKCLKEQHPNEPLFEFITYAYKWLDENPGNSSDFHIYFLFELSRYLGFEPHNNYDASNIYFDTREGKFTSEALGFPLGLDKEQSLLFCKLFDPALIDVTFTRKERGELLECLLAYYRMHVAGFNELRSLPVLRELFSA
jgi:DNA repair protein RecO (recombination protein O)